ncbi:MAG: NADH-quinone oxidoreductase subunit J [Candidatus Dormibacteraeota bacterium]|uniref:NADH-quinone oxidoreductase subunit J n=1 Tax=Candidatus Aeolococcus gillhamiae TaxID=3127015 RepID=A0A2W5Z4Q0_9BACT|nr:NADH-quinone oxidoreductase subunit J [Candidatus Dormibacteraeota bacterium]PZR80319.1 MAG: NADH-quinone oxidoreductase subunit J [Candidatus Dormibacter sp. RRmetagenome_bin12]
MSVIIWVAGVLAALSALGVVFSPQPLYSALSLVLTIGALGVVFLVLNAQFLFVVQLIVYAGAVMVLFVFIIALLSPGAEDRVRIDSRFVIGAVVALGITVAMVVAARNGITFNANGVFRAQQIGQGSDPYHTFSFDQSDIGLVNTAGNVQTVGGQLFTTFLLPFEITSLLLLVAAVGAVYLTRRLRAQNQPSRRQAPLTRRPTVLEEERIEVEVG